MKTKKPQKVVVCYSNAIDQWGTLPPCFITVDGKYEVMMHDSLKTWIEPKGITFNADLALVSTYNLDPLLHPMVYMNDEYHPSNLIMFRRANKTAQNCLINGTGIGMKFKKHQPVMVYDSSNTKTNNSVWGYLPDGQYVLKPSDGARGVGQLVVNLGKGGIQIATMARLYDALKKMDASDVYLNYQKWLDEVAKYEPHVQYFKGHGSLQEGVSALHEQSLTIQRRVDNVAEEFRVLVNHDSTELNWFKRRLDNTVGAGVKNLFDYKQATGAVETADAVQHVDESVIFDLYGRTAINEIKKLCQNLKLGMNSLDVFFTTDGKWGIFEYSPQWGAVGMDPTWLHTFMSDNLSALLDQR